MKMAIHAILTVRSDKIKSVSVLIPKSLDVESVREINEVEKLTAIKFTKLDSVMDSNLEDVLAKLQEKKISFSFEWQDDEITGEKHFRAHVDGNTQYLSWLDQHKNFVNTERVRHALDTGGETAVLELLDEAEQNFTPWEWTDVAA